MDVSETDATEIFFEKAFKALGVVKELLLEVTRAAMAQGWEPTDAAAKELRKLADPRRVRGQGSRESCEAFDKLCELEKQLSVLANTLSDP